MVNVAWGDSAMLSEAGAWWNPPKQMLPVAAPRPMTFNAPYAGENVESWGGLTAIEPTDPFCRLSEAVDAAFPLRMKLTPTPSPPLATIVLLLFVDVVDVFFAPEGLVGLNSHVS